MKTLKITAFLLLFILTKGLQGQTSSNEGIEKKVDETIIQEDKYPQTVLIRMIEFHEGLMIDKSKIVVVQPDNSIETIDLDKSKLIKGEGDGFASNSNKLKVQIQKWHNLGFSVKSSSASSPNTHITLTTIFLQKN